MDGRGGRYAARDIHGTDPYLNQTEPLFDVLRVTERGFTGMVADHRNILKVLKDPTLTESSVAVQYNVTSDPRS